jgi:hypothetical protein
VTGDLSANGKPVASPEAATPFDPVAEIAGTLDPDEERDLLRRQVAHGIPRDHPGMGLLAEVIVTSRRFNALRKELDDSAERLRKSLQELIDHADQRADQRFADQLSTLDARLEKAMRHAPVAVYVGPRRDAMRDVLITLGTIVIATLLVLVGTRLSEWRIAPALVETALFAAGAATLALAPLIRRRKTKRLMPAERALPNFKSSNGGDPSIR